VREGLAWASGAADSLFAVQGLGTYPIHTFGSAEQKSRFIAGALSGRAVAAFALTEPEAGTDVASMQTVAVKDSADPTRWRLTGTKTFISNAPVAEQMVVFANADPPLRRKGITAFIVKRNTPGLIVQGPIAMIADHSIGTLHKDGALVSDADRLGEIGAGFDGPCRRSIPSASASGRPRAAWRAARSTRRSTARWRANSSAKRSANFSRFRPIWRTRWPSSTPHGSSSFAPRC
jgi:acyl-CoA dehydrogenase